MRLEFTVPIKATSSLNARLHWAVRAKKVKGERMATRLAALAIPSVRERISRVRLPAVITLTRLGPRKLDGDNVQGCLKAIRDEVARMVGFDDGDPRIDWRYSQEKGPYSVRVVIESAQEEAA